MKENKAYIALFLVCIIWGTTYLVNKIGVSQIPSLMFSGVRQLIAGGILLSYFFLIKKEKLPDRDYLLRQLFLGILLIGGGNGLGTFGLQYIDSGISAILATTSPLMVAMIVLWLQPEDKLNERGWYGLILGFLGISMILFQKVSFNDSPNVVLGILFTMASVITWSVGTVLGKSKGHTYSPLLSAGFQMLFGGIPIFIASFIFERPLLYTFEWMHGIIWAYLIIFGSLIAYSSFVYSLKHLPVTIVSLHTYINPILAVILGIIILHEKMNMWIGLGACLSLLGVYLVNRSSVRKQTSET